MLDASGQHGDLWPVLALAGQAVAQRHAQTRGPGGLAPYHRQDSGDDLRSRCFLQYVGDDSEMGEPDEQIYLFVHSEQNHKVVPCLVARESISTMAQPEAKIFSTVDSA